MDRLTTLVFDKTGTLTTGKPSVVEVMTTLGWDRDRLLGVAAAAESASEHPLARALQPFASDRMVSDFRAIRGQGVRAVVDGKVVLVGSETLLEDAGINQEPIQSAAEVWEHDALTVLRVAVDDRAAGAIALADTLKPAAREVVDALRKRAQGWSC